MKILYAIQGTGNGHISRARDIIPHLKKWGDLHILVSGTQADVALNYPVTYRLKGLSFIFGKKGGVDVMRLIKRQCKTVMERNKIAAGRELRYHYQRF